MLSIFFFSDDQFTLQLSESEVEEEEDEGVPDLPGRYSLIINWLYHNCAILLYHTFIFQGSKA